METCITKTLTTNLVTGKYVSLYCQVVIDGLSMPDGTGDSIILRLLPLGQVGWLVLMMRLLTRYMLIQMCNMQQAVLLKKRCKEIMDRTTLHNSACPAETNMGGVIAPHTESLTREIQL